MVQEQRFVIEKLDNGDIKGGTSVRKAVDELSTGRWVVGIRKYVKHRTPAQNSLIHMYFNIIADETGNDLKRVKDILKKEFLTTELKDAMGNIICNPKTGEPLTYVRDTSDLDTWEMSVFTEKVRIFALDFNIILPLPEDQLKLKV
jgi:hypothetical protein